MQHAKSLAVCLALVVAAYLVGRSTLEAQQPVPTLDRQFTPGTVFADARTPISSLPYTIDRCGSYFLTGCLTGASSQDGITVAVSNVTIDLNGFALSGLDMTGSGVLITPGTSNITVRNGILQNWETGLKATQADSIRLHTLTACSNATSGIQAGTRSLLVDCISARNDDGILAGEGSNVRACLAFDNDSVGIRISDYSVMRGCTATNNGDVGLQVHQGSVAQSSASGLNRFGLRFQDGGGSVASQCSIGRNTSTGVSGNKVLLHATSVCNNNPEVSFVASTLHDNHTCP